jgi:hypothetical protein
MGQKANRNVSIYGQGDTSLSDLAKASNELLTNHTPNSGTVARLAAQAALPVALGTAGAFKEGDWQGAAKGVALGAALPKAAQLMLNRQGLQGAANVVGSLGKKASMPVLSGGALQRVPAATALGIVDQYRKVPDTSSQ